MSNSFIHHPRPTDSQSELISEETSGRAASYRDPSGFIFEKEGVLYRQVNQNFKAHFDHFISSGFYESLVKKNLLIPHETIKENLAGFGEWYLTLKPERIAFISYPYEWCFDMLKDAALLTLQLLKEAVGSGLVLKDATPYNIQWHRGKLIFIDTLSFEKYNEEEPWIAYRQFCENFVGPLLLMHYSKNPLQQLALAYPEGIPLAVTGSLLPWRSKFRLHIYLHIHLHSRVAQKKQAIGQPKIKFSKQKLLNLISSLEILVRQLKLPVQKSAWSEYYDEASQRKDYLEKKRELIEKWLNKLGDLQTAADLGANNGEFSRLLSAKNIQTIASDFDPYCINKFYTEIKKSGEKNIQPLIIDLANPSPAIGVNNDERASFISRTRVDLSLALALIHHLAIGKNIPFELIAAFFRPLSKHLIIEFVPKEDEKVQLMLSCKKNIYAAYDEAHFEQAFKKYYTIVNKETIEGSGRILYLMIRS